jgi:hypothetical protein
LRRRQAWHQGVAGTICSKLEAYAFSLWFLFEQTALGSRLQPGWLEFTAGPQLLEGLNAGSIDFGYVGEVLPVFALAAGARFVYIAYELPTPKAEHAGHLGPDRHGRCFPKLEEVFFVHVSDFRIVSNLSS